MDQRRLSAINKQMSHWSALGFFGFLIDLVGVAYFASIVNFTLCFLTGLLGQFLFFAAFYFHVSYVKKLSPELVNELRIKISHFRYHLVSCYLLTTIFFIAVLFRFPA